MKTIAQSLLAIPLCSLSLATPAATTPSVDQMRKQLHELQQRYEEQGNAMRSMEERLQQMEKNMQVMINGEKSLKTAQKTKPASTEASSSPQNIAANSAKEEVVREAPPSRSAESVYQEQHALFDRRLTFEAGLSYSRYDKKQLALNGFLALDAIFLGNINVDTVKADIWTLDLTGRYTLSDRMQVDLNAPFLYRNTSYLSAGAGYASTDYAEKSVAMGPKLGDISAGLYYQLYKETQTRPDIVWNVRVKAPSGSNPYGTKLEEVPGSGGNLKVPTELSSGNGVWAASTGLSFVKTVDPAIVFASLNYFHNFPRHFDDISSTSGTNTPGDIKLGDSFQYGLGTAFALNERMSLSTSFTQRFTAKSRSKQDGFGWQNIPGSDANSAMLNFGATYSLNDKESVVVNVGAGLTPDAPNATIGLKYLSSY